MPKQDDTPSDSSHFHTTHWSVVHAAGSPSSPDVQVALTELCQAYWRPLYAFLRRAGHDADEARDLTQGFFADFLARHHCLDGLDPEQGRFRSYLLGALKHFLANERARSEALKRGGGVQVLPLELDDAEERLRFEPADERSPAADFERQWALALLTRVLGRLRDEQDAKGRGGLFARLRPVLAGGELDGGYPAVAADLEMTPVAVKVAAHRLRQRYRQLLLEEVGHTVERPEDAEDEIRHLFLALGG